MKMYGILHFILFVSVASALSDTGLNLKKHENTAITGLSPVSTAMVTRPLRCFRLCRSHSSCLAFSLMSATCEMYSTNEFTSKLIPQNGSTVYSVTFADRIVGSLLDLQEFSGGAPNLFPELTARRKGYVMKWKVG